MERTQIIETGGKRRNFVTLQENDNRIMHLMTNVKSRKKRAKSRQIILEGQRMIVEGLKACLVPNVIFFSRISDVEHLELPEETQLYKIPYRTIQLWSNVTTSPGLMGIFTIPSVETSKTICSSKNALPMTIICDNVREPGNLGSILRVAAGVGCEQLILMKGCVDVWDPKVLRSAAGAHFRVPILTSQIWSDIPSLISDNASIFVADNDTTFKMDAHLYTTNQNSDNDSLFSKCENNQQAEEEKHVLRFKKIKTGLEEAGEHTGYHQTLKNQESSLNIESNASSQNSSQQHKNVQAKDSKNQKHEEIKLNGPKEKELHNDFMTRIPVVPYYSVQYTKREVVLVVSGETEGLNLDSFNVLHKRDSIRVNVPLANGLESLNSGVAVGIVAFEVQRQFLARHSELADENMYKATLLLP
ncbi:hypothetical protein KM043_013860 [Ampulex compressa]|nr:hypothetical protein KM043_013860 [Ampulex compressa]